MALSEWKAKIERRVAVLKCIQICLNYNLESKRFLSSLMYTTASIFNYHISNPFSTVHSLSWLLHLFSSCHIYCFPLQSSLILPHFVSVSISLSSTHTKKKKTCTLSLITSLFHSVISGHSRSEVFIFSRPITKQVVLPDTERHWVWASIPRALQHLNWEHGCHSLDTLTILITSLLSRPQ